MTAPRLAVVCDLLEENWLSMDLVADRLLASLKEDHEGVVDARRVRPPMRRRFSSAGPPRVDGSLRFNLDRGLNRFWDYPRLLRRARGEFDVFHIVDHSYSHLVHSLPPERTVITCHDLVTFHSLLEPGRGERSRPFRMMTRYILDGMGKASRVVFDTTPVRDAAIELKLVAPERARVVPLGVHPAHSPHPDGAADREVVRLLGPRRAETPEILHVAGTFDRKRIDLTLRIFAAVRRIFPGTRLIRVGGAFKSEHLRLVRELGLADSIDVLPYLERPVLSAVYRRADLAILPSEDEGFGLPVLEAMTCGTPIVASDLPVLREVGGTAASYVPVGEIEQWAEVVAAILTERRSGASSWEERRAAGLAQAALFSWSEYARKMIDVYQEVVRQ